tara:strand:+ start:890 stop:2041 length:1152 start_codon:yes stop_codon:yes gene_type:complete
MSKYFSPKITLRLGLVLILLTLPFFIEATPKINAETTLSKIKNKLVRLNSYQTNENQKKRTLKTELKRIDISIAKTSQTLENANLTINQMQQDIKQIQTEQNPLKNRFDEVKNQLSQYLILSTQLNKANPLFLILNKKDPSLTTRLMNYLGYIKKYQTDLLLEVTLLSHSLEEKKIIIQQKLNSLSLLQKQQAKRLQTYNDDKQLQRDIINNISMQLTDRSLRIKELKRNERKLKNILTNIEQIQQRQTDKNPFYALKNVLPWPIKQKIKDSQLNITKDIRSNGLFIRAQEGRQIHAVRTGKIVFADWLRGYGLLIILQHDHGFMTLYANNQALYKDKGDNAYTGEKIATVGHSGGQLDDGLYFEIRHKGKALPPLSWLKRNT